MFSEQNSNLELVLNHPVHPIAFDIRLLLIRISVIYAIKPLVHWLKALS